ncbi:MAG: cytochrome c oxidase subunit II [Betaproteobacteria bacterium]|nr:cytochrome c oxidase subunit II [Betaproteobacteria bacterium]
MNATTPLWALPAASDTASRVDALFLVVLAVTGAVTLAIFAVMAVFAIRYRRGSPAQRASPPTQSRVVELTWTFTPLAVFLCFFAWAALVYGSFYRADPAAMTIYVVGKQWMWKAQHANGRREIDELHLPAGQPVRLVLSSEDVIHSFFVPAFRIKQDAVPGRYTAISFTPTRPGVYRLHCAEYCGTDHANMGGRVYVMQPAAFAQWLEQGPSGASLAAQGFELFRRLGCSGCHDARSSVHAPELDGVYGRTVHLADGRTIVADEPYLRDSILLPKKDVVAGFEPIMPSFQGQVSEADLSALISFLKSLQPGGPSGK